MKINWQQGAPPPDLHPPAAENTVALNNTAQPVQDIAVQDVPAQNGAAAQGTTAAHAAVDADLSLALGYFCEELGLPGVALNVLFADDIALAALNLEHRGKDTSTDILSWSYLPLSPLPPGISDSAEDIELPLAGELALSLDRARAQAMENGWDLRTEVLRLLAHGCAHVGGFEHNTPEEDMQMKAVEMRMLARAGLHDIYPES